MTDGIDEKWRGRRGWEAYVWGTGADECFIVREAVLETRVGLGWDDRSDDDEKTVRKNDKYVYGSTWYIVTE